MKTARSLGGGGIGAAPSTITVYDGTLVSKMFIRKLLGD